MDIVRGTVLCITDRLKLDINPFEKKLPQMQWVKYYDVFTYKSYYMNRSCTPGNKPLFTSFFCWFWLVDRLIRCSRRAIFLTFPDLKNDEISSWDISSNKSSCEPSRVESGLGFFRVFDRLQNLMWESIQWAYNQRDLSSQTHSWMVAFDCS